MAVAVRPDTGAGERALYLPAPLRHQRPVLQSASRRKLWRAGRRTGKSRAALLAAVDGHGPLTDGVPALKGLLQGGDVVWLSPDYPQSAAIWREEVLPRFEGLPGVTILRSERRVEVQGLGSLELRSAEAIDGLRGRRLDGVIVDEAAYLDLEYSLGAVVMPTLVDRDGWLLLISSPNGGHDGNSAKRVPSWFNLLAEEVEAGARHGWVAFHNRTEDNPTLPVHVIEALRREYPPGSLTAQQELDGLLVAGGGRFYPELLEAEAVRWCERPALPDWGEFWGAYDWGYSHPAAFAQFARLGNVVYLLDTLYLHKAQDEEQAAQIRGWADVRCLRQVYAGHDAFAKRMAHSAAVESVADIFDRYGISLGRANFDRAAGAKAVRRLFAKVEGGKGVELRVVDTAGNRRVFDELAKLVPDPLNFDVPAKRDANERGEHGDDGADVFRYGVATPSFETMEPVKSRRTSNVTDGRDDVHDPFEAAYEQSRSGYRVEYSQRPAGPEGQFGW
ncbi:MAG: hypothetical protein ACO277_08170 [Ilumatobacteraceae bacterium]